MKNPRLTCWLPLLGVEPEEHLSGGQRGGRRTGAPGGARQDDGRGKPTASTTTREVIVLLAYYCGGCRRLLPSVLRPTVRRTTPGNEERGGAGLGTFASGLVHDTVRVWGYYR